MVELQPDSYSAIQEFLRDFKSERPRSIWRVGRSGFKNEVESKYISSDTLAEQLPLERVERLLAALFEGSNRPTPDASLVKRHYLRSFAILLCIGAGKFINSFTDEFRLRDHYLPHDNKPLQFPTATDRDLFAEFQAEQPPFCPYPLEFDIGYTLGEHDILPINSQERVDEGGSAIIWKVVVDAEYDNLVQRGGNATNAVLNKSHTYIVKTYRAVEAHKYYEIERDAFRRLRWNGKPPANVIEYYGSFVRGSTYSIILEYADLKTLDEYLENHLPPQNHAERMLFWRQFMLVFYGLVRIHGQPGNDEELQIFRGWHQDIDPSNILVVSRGGSSVYDCDFKIADLGLSHFKRYASSPENDVDQDTFGTSAYGSPETQRRNVHLQSCVLKVKQGVDIWSLGCVLSEVVTWINHGWPKVEECRRRRRLDLKDNTGNQGDCFHDGVELLPSVKQTHEELVEDCRKNDDITPLIVTQVFQKMLQNSKDRPEAKYLADRADDIIKKAERLLHSPDRDQPSCFKVEPETNNIMRQPKPPTPKSQSHHSASNQQDPRQRPEMSIADGKGYKYPLIVSRRKFPNQERFESLDGRDHAFLIDTSSSMAPYREDVKDVLDLLAYMLLESDPDGLDLYFTDDGKKLRHKTLPSILEEFGKHPNEGTPDMRERFAAITESYQEKFGKTNLLASLFRKKNTPAKGPRRLSLYVLTDAVWQPKMTLTTEIDTLVNHLLEHRLTNKQIGIQFIRFGNDQKGIRRLKKLDAEMRLKLDIVDHTPANGDVWKMLLGAINPGYDDDEAEEGEEEEEHEDGHKDSDHVPGMNGATARTNRAVP